MALGIAMDFHLWPWIVSIGAASIAAIGIAAKLADIPKIWKAAKPIWKRAKPVHEVKLRDAVMLERTFFGKLFTYNSKDWEVIIEVVVSASEKITGCMIDLDLGPWGRYQALKTKKEVDKAELEAGERLMTYRFIVPWEKLEIKGAMKQEFKPTIRLRSDTLISSWIGVVWREDPPSN